MKLSLAFTLMTLISFSAFASGLETAAECVTDSEDANFKILTGKIPKIRKHTSLIIVENEDTYKEDDYKNVSNAVVTKMNRNFVHIKLTDGREIKFSENGGLKTTFNGMLYKCSNPINFNYPANR